MLLFSETEKEDALGTCGSSVFREADVVAASLHSKRLIYLGCNVEDPEGGNNN